MLAHRRQRAFGRLLALFFVIGSLDPGAAQQVNQLKLTEAQVLGLLAAQNDFAPLAGKLAEAADKPSAQLIAKLDAIAQKHGFKTFEEYRDVDNNIFLVLEGLDRETGDYVPPKQRLALEIDEVQNDTTIPDDDKKEILNEVREELSLSEAVVHPTNVDLVKKHLDKLAKLLPTPEDPGLPPPGSGSGDEVAQ